MIVTNSQENQNQKRIVTAPQSNVYLNSTMINIPSTVISVELNENEEVEWFWTTYDNGQRVVTGYDIIENDRSKSA